MCINYSLILFLLILGYRFCGETDEARHQLRGAPLQEASGCQATPAPGVYSRIKPGIYYRPGVHL